MPVIFHIVAPPIVMLNTAQPVGGKRGYL